MLQEGLDGDQLEQSVALHEVSLFTDICYFGINTEGQASVGVGMEHDEEDLVKLLGGSCRVLVWERNFGLVSRVRQLLDKATLGSQDISFDVLLLVLCSRLLKVCELILSHQHVAVLREVDVASDSFSDGLEQSAVRGQLLNGVGEVSAVG